MSASARADVEIARECLVRVGMDGLAHSPYRALSGAQHDVYAERSQPQAIATATPRATYKIVFHSSTRIPSERHGGIVSDDQELLGREYGSLSAAFALATVVGVVAAVAGIAGSYWLDLPTGPTIVGILAVVFGLSYLWAATRRA